MKQNINFLIKKRESTGLNIKIILKLLLNTRMIWMIFIKILNKKHKILTVLMIRLLSCLVTKKLNLIVTELFIRGRKSNISLVFDTQSYFDAPKNVRLNSMHYTRASASRI